MLLFDFDWFQSTNIKINIFKYKKMHSRLKLVTPQKLNADLCQDFVSSNKTDQKEETNLWFQQKYVLYFYWFMNLISLPYRVVYNSTQVICLFMKLIIFATLIIVTIFVDEIDNELKILWLSTFIDTFNSSIDNYRQILSCIDLLTTFSMIDFDWQVTPWE